MGHLEDAVALVAAAQEKLNTAALAHQADLIWQAGALLIQVGGAPAEEFAGSISGIQDAIAECQRQMLGLDERLNAYRA